MSVSVLVSIVDDDAQMLDAYERLLNSFGYSTATYASAKDFLNSDRLSKTSCLISDIQMPEMGGYELQLRLIAYGHKFPVIFLTAHVDDTLRDRLLAAGAHAVLTKPFHARSLIDCLMTAIKRSQDSIKRD